MVKRGKYVIHGYIYDGVTPLICTVHGVLYRDIHVLFMRLILLVELQTQVREKKEDDHGGYGGNGGSRGGGGSRGSGSIGGIGGSGNTRAGDCFSIC